MGGRTGALELQGLVMLSDRVVLEEVLHGTLEVVPDGGGTGDIALNCLFNFEYRVFFCNQEGRASRSEDQFVVQ